MNICGWCGASVTYVLFEGTGGKWPRLCDAFSEDRHDCTPWRRYREERTRPRLPVAVAPDPAVVAAQAQTRAVASLEQAVGTLSKIVTAARSPAVGYRPVRGAHHPPPTSPESSAPRQALGSGESASSIAEELFGGVRPG